MDEIAREEVCDCFIVLSLWNAEHRPRTNMNAKLLCKVLPAIALLLSVQLALCAKFEARVVKVIDGDTVEVMDAARHRARVRLAGCDAPEKGQPYGSQSTRHLRSLVYRKTVTVDWYKKDDYHRLVGNVWVASSEACLDAEAACERNIDVGLAQIDAGMAWYYRHYEHEQSVAQRTRYAHAEDDARRKQLGLWTARQKAIPPWDWRHSARSPLR
jgi:endonuclease YncB( thermonuclease family)